MSTTLTQDLRGRLVTHDEAARAAQRLVNSHFHNEDHARVSIPLQASDDDVVISDYVKEQREINTALLEALKGLFRGTYSKRAHEECTDCNFKRALAAIAAAEGRTA